MNGNSCDSCAAECNTCLSTDTASCTSCPSGFALINSRCNQRCPSNCRRCTDTDACQECLDGYAANANGVCLPCMDTCKICSGTENSVCLECGDGLILDPATSTCVNCPTNCRTCSLSSGSPLCLQCNPGYDLTASSTCEITCSEPCATCDAGTASSCTACLLGYTLSGNMCSPNIDCDSSSSCTVCPLGYTLSGGNCVMCNSPCGRCDPTNPSTCTACMEGMYLSASSPTCVACPTGCTECITSSACLSCEPGYTLLDNPTTATQTCVACEGRCLTCLGAPEQCTECTSGSTMEGWTCLLDVNVGFDITFTNGTQIFFQNYGEFLSYLSNSTGERDTTVDEITMNTVVEGSTVANGQTGLAVDAADTTGLDNSVASFNSRITPGTFISGMEILSSSTTVNGYTPGSASNISRNLALILAITIPLAVISRISTCLI